MKEQSGGRVGEKCNTLDRPGSSVGVHEESESGTVSTLFGKLNEKGDSWVLDRQSFLGD